MPGILIIDDEESIQRALVHHFVSRGWDAAGADSGERGLQSVEKLTPDIILLDMKLPDMNGIDVLKMLKAQNCASSVVIMTGWGSIANAVAAIKLGAEQYLTKSVDLVELDAVVDRIVEMRKLRLETRYYQQRLDHPIVGASMEIQKLHHLTDLMAENAGTTVLLLGESGTGKELVAREIHRRSARRDRPFLDINCATLPEALIESEIFGHERGAFTDARELKRGLLEVADGGTVLLDEIADLPLTVQPKLLRVLETRCFKRVGGNRDMQVDVRIIAATNKDLSKPVADGRFREDLYYRLKVFPILLPPLRERPGDVPLLISYFVSQLNATLNKSIRGFTPGALERMQKYSWPGNVRELRNIVERAMVLSRSDIIDIDVLPREMVPVRSGGFDSEAATVPGRTSVLTLAEMEKEYILKIFRAHGQNRTVTAKVLGISRSTLQEKLKKYGILEREVRR